MVQSILEYIEDDIKTALAAVATFDAFTKYSEANDDIAADFYRTDLPAIIISIESVPSEHLLDGSLLNTADIIIALFIAWNYTEHSLTRKRLMNYKLELLQNAINVMAFSSNVNLVSYNLRAGQGATKEPFGEDEDEFLYTGSIGMTVEYLRS